MKVVAVLNIDQGWVDLPTVAPAYIFNNMRDLLDSFSDLGVVEIVKDLQINNLYDFGIVNLSDNNDVKYEFTCMYAENSYQ